MKTELIRIGNSRGVRIPKTLIEQCGLGEKVDLRVENECLVISPERRPREDWNEIFRAAAPVPTTNYCWKACRRMDSMRRNGSGRAAATAG